jgi:hypothetical protein
MVSEEGISDGAGAEATASWPDRVTQELDRAIARPDRTGVYAGPWWDLAPTGPGAASPGWKRAILRRWPGGGAEHWGHLFLILSTDPAATSIRVASLPIFDDSRSAGFPRRTFRLPAPVGAAWLIARPSTTMGEVPLGVLAEEMALALGGTEET